MIRVSMKKAKAFFGLGFGVEALRLQYKGKVMTYTIKIFLGRHVVNTVFHTKARKNYKATYGI